MEEMPKIQNTVLRGKTYYLRMRIPKDLLHIYEGKKEIQRTLRTSSAAEARRKVRLEALLVQEEFDARRKAQALISHERSINDLSETEIASMVLRWYREKDDEQYNSDLTYQNPDKQSHEEILENLREEKNYRASEIAQQKFVARSLDTFLEERSIKANHQSVQYRRLADLLSRAEYELITRSLQRYENRPITGTGDLFFSYSPLTSAKLIEASFGQLCKIYIEEKSKGLKLRSQKQLEEEVIFLQKLINPAQRLGNITRIQCREVYEKIQKLPANASKIYPRLSLDQAIVQGKADGRPLLSPGRINAYLSRLSSMFKFAQVEEYIEGNPAASFTMVDPINQQDKRLPFQAEHLNTIFSSPFYQANEKTTGRYWVPLISLWTGMRMDECCRIHASDIKQYGDIYAIEIVRTLKTKNSKRVVPIHSALVDLGLIDFINQKKDSGQDHLFSDLHYSEKQQNYSHSFSKWFSRYLDNMEIKDKRLCFHSFRHTFRDALAAQNTPLHITRAICGWKGGGMEEVYGSPARAETLYGYLSKISYPNVDLSHLIKNLNEPRFK